MFRIADVFGEQCILLPNGQCVGFSPKGVLQMSIDEMRHYCYTTLIETVDKKDKECEKNLKNAIDKSNKESIFFHTKYKEYEKNEKNEKKLKKLKK
jgi:hypothetical protein